MKILISTIIALLSVSVISCKKQDDSTTTNKPTTDKSQKVENKFLGEWTEVEGRKTISLVEDNGELYFVSGNDRFKTISRSSNVLDVDYGSFGLHPLEIEEQTGHLLASFKGNTKRFKRSETQSK